MVYMSFLGPLNHYFGLIYVSDLFQNKLDLKSLTLY